MEYLKLMMMNKIKLKHFLGIAHTMPNYPNTDDVIYIVENFIKKDCFNIKLIKKYLKEYDDENLTNTLKLMVDDKIIEVNDDKIKMLNS